jgi:hypothetical protein
MPRATHLVGLVAGAMLVTAVGSGAAGCAETPVQLALRALQSSGPVSFVCLGAPDDPNFARPLTDCSSGSAADEDFGTPHLYMLVTQPLTGEVAVVDMTSRAIVDQDPSTPGSNFLPVGSLPTDIVSTPGGAASFATVSETNFEAIYGLPSDMIRGSRPRISSWPACALPAAPGEILLFVDPAEDGVSRPSCDAAYGDGDPGDLGDDAQRAGTPGRYKLAVTLPGEGGIAIIDAQNILDQDAGVREPCVIERWIELKVELPPTPPQPPPPADNGCVPPEGPNGSLSATSFKPLPAGMTRDGDRLYIADRAAPVIHRLDMKSPCEPFELPPLATASAEDPNRTVFTSRVAVSPLTLDLERYLYAIDVIDGSIMVYDVSDDSPSLFPLQRANAQTNPFQPTDRLRFQTPPRDIVILQHQNDNANEVTGSTLPIRCDATSGSNSPGSDYQTNDEFDRGAGPRRLRGVFAFAILESGDIVVIDIDDYDAECRGPKFEDNIFGCADPASAETGASGEFTCNAVQPHQARSADFLVTADNLPFNQQPGVVAFPALFDDEGTIIQLEEGTELSQGPSPRMRATIPAGSPTPFNVAVSNDLEELHASEGVALKGPDSIDTENHVLVMNLVDPRAHIVDQVWTVIYEGAIPGFKGLFAELTDTGSNGAHRLREINAGFCDRGVQSQNALADLGASANLADYVQIISETPVEADQHWDGQQECTFNECAASYGTVELKRTSRDFTIVEASQDALDIIPRDSSSVPRLKCCFPGVVEFRVRTGNQWTVSGDIVGMLNNTTTNDDGVCRPSCDPNLASLNGRATETDFGPVNDDDPGAFSNPFFRFAINSGAQASARDMQFNFTTRGKFTPLTLSVVTQEPDVQPVSTTYLPLTGELVVSDGSLDGITTLDLNSLTITDHFN